MIDSDVAIRSNDAFEQFYTTIPSKFCVLFREVPELPKCEGILIQELMGIDVYLNGNGDYVRQFHEEKQEELPYAVQQCNWKKKKIFIYYMKHGVANINHVNGAFFHIAWEDMMLKESRLIIHACCVETKLGGILFSGRSGIGKSTQGDLWCRYEDAELINGDRPIVCKMNGEWTAYGSPYAGSSSCHINAHTSVRVIVMLSQEKECSIRRLGEAEAFRKIFAQLTLSICDSLHINRACNLAEQLIAEVPVYELACTPDYAAVELLKKTLQ